ncbi:MAG: hypothetical protein JKY93_09255 [Gammaproteobacteria bacterium]|nr:hypothetical protein [Gammaproteobacteria bacterium]
MSDFEDNALRDHIGRLMTNGLETQTEPFPEDNIAFEDILTELKHVDPLDSDALTQKLIISGFINKPYGEDELRCLECIYYLVNRKWCDLPELALPVEPNWWCRLWKI